MVYNNLLNIIFYFILFIIMFDIACIALVLFSKITENSSDLFKFYLKNKYFSIFCVFFYIIFFIVILYVIRINNINRPIDLNKIYSDFYSVIATFFELSLLTKFVMFFIIVFAITNILLIFVLLHKYFINHLRILYIYYRYAGNKYSRFEINQLCYKISEPSDLDIISYFIHKLSFKLAKLLHKNYKYQDLPWYDFHKIISKIIKNKYYPLFISFSPFYVILYDCIFNNFVIVHLYKYLIIFIPLMIWRRITSFIYKESHYLGELLWDIYYKKETCIYAISFNDYKLLEIYLLTNLHRNVDLGLEPEIFLRDSLCYESDPYEKNIYRNFEGDALEKTPDNKVLKEINTGDDFIKEEWILLVEKFHYKNDYKYKTLVYIN